METASITSKHQITIPSKVRRAMNLRKGDRLAFEVGDGGSYLLRKVSLQKSDGAAVAYLRFPRESLDVSEMRAAVAKGALGSYQKSRQ